MRTIALNAALCLFATVITGTGSASAQVLYQDTTGASQSNFIPFGPDGTPARPVPGDHMGNQVTLAGKKVILKAECLDAKCKCLADAIQNGQGQVGFPTDKAKLALALCNRLRLYVNGADQKTLGCE